MGKWGGLAGVEAGGKSDEKITCSADGGVLKPVIKESKQRPLSSQKVGPPLADLVRTGCAQGLPLRSEVQSQPCSQNPATLELDLVPRGSNETAVCHAHPRASCAARECPRVGSMSS
jgi:hypothetical protein